MLTRLGEALALLRQEDWQAAIPFLRDLLREEALSPGYPARQLVSAAHGLPTRLPDPHLSHAIDCLERARQVLSTVQPGQT